MTDETAAPVAKPKRKPRKRAARTKKPDAVKVAYPGLTETTCANACNQKGCVISGNLTCAHPHKGGLRGADMGDVEALKRLQSAQKQLAVGAAGKRFA